MTQRTPINYKRNTFPNSGFISGRPEPEDLKPIWDEVNEIMADFEGHADQKANDYLAGNIVREYSLVKCRDHVERMMLPFAAMYASEFGFSGKFTEKFNHGQPLRDRPVLDKLWVNFQKKGEFNPTHWHPGLLSFALWLQIPYTFEDEQVMSPGREGTSNRAGAFEFVYTDTLGGVMNHPIPTTKLMEGSLIVFPSTMDHRVYPFYTSDDYRISVSGNFVSK